MKLLIDIGNTRLKWSLAGDALGPVGHCAHDGGFAAAMNAMDCERPDAIHICSVMGPAAELEITAACTDRWKLEPIFARSQRSVEGFRSGYAEPERLGVDRWLAMLAAWQKTRGACIVADAGTALTIDVIDPSGQHLGGIIAAGLRTSMQAILGATRFPVRTLDEMNQERLGQDTESCVSRGALLSCVGAIEQTSSVMPGARKFICGGDAETLMPLLDSDWQHAPHLVLQGLLNEALGD